jgi:hypothetical protein
LLLGGCTALLGIDLAGKHAIELDASAPSDAQGAPSPFTVVQQLPQGPPLAAIWGADADHIFAVGADDTTYVFDTGVWSKFGGNRPGHNLNAVWGRSARDVFAVGGSAAGGGFVQHYDGNAWTPVYATPAALFGVWGTPDGFVIAVGARGGLYAWHAGQEWHSFGPLSPHPAVNGPEDPILWSIAGRNFDDFGIAGGRRRIFHSEVQGGIQAFATYDVQADPNVSFRTAWQAPGAATNLLFGTNYFGIVGLSVSGGAPDSSTTPGVVYQTPVLFRDEASPNAGERFIQGLWGTAATVVAVGDEGRIYRIDMGSQVVDRLPSPTETSLTGVWGSGLGDIWMVGDHELIVHGSLAP